MDRMDGLGLFVAGLGVVMVWWGLTRRSQANALTLAAQAWPVASGSITAADIFRSGRGRYATFSPLVRYDYEVGGRRYSGDRLRVGYARVGSMVAARRMLEPYPVGASVPVRYDPADPASSLLDLTTSSAPLLTAVIGGLLALFGLVIVAAT